MGACPWWSIVTPERYVTTADGPTLAFLGRTFTDSDQLVIKTQPTYGRVLFIAPQVEIGNCVFLLSGDGEWPTVIEITHG